MFESILSAVQDHVSAARALEMLRDIHHWDRWSTFAAYRRSGAYIAERMREAGLEQVEEFEIPADGLTRFGDWTMPLAWDVAQATLEVVEPAEGQRLLANYLQEPACLAAWSAPTALEGELLEVVRIDDGSKAEHYADLDVAGKVILTRKHSGAVRKQAVRHGARGIISDYPANEDDALQNAVAWVNAWSDGHGWGYLASDTPLIGFQLNREGGAYLRRLIEAGSTVRVCARVHGSLHRGSFLAPTGVIAGRSDEEVLVFGHSYEYGAEDNASGCAAILEAAFSLAQLIAAGVLPRPRRSIRFMMSWECYGSIPWAVERIAGRRQVVGGLCLDDLAAKLALTGGSPKLVRNPHCQASYTDALAQTIAAAAFNQAPEMVAWEPGTDHAVFQDPLFDVPMPLFTDHPGRYHHTSLDEPANIDRERLGQTAAFAATYLYALADAGAAEAPWLAGLACSDWSRRLVEAGERAQERLAEAVDEDGLNRILARESERIRYLTQRGRAACKAALRLGEDEAARAAVERNGAMLCVKQGHILEALHAKAADIAEAHGWTVRPHPGEMRQPGEGGLRPKRLVPGLATLTGLSREDEDRLMGITGGRNPMWAPPLILAIYWADGRRDLGEIRHLLEMELGEEALEGLDLTAYFHFLAEHGLVGWEPPQR